MKNVMRMTNTRSRHINRNISNHLDQVLLIVDISEKNLAFNYMTEVYGPWQDVKSYTSVIVTIDTSSGVASMTQPPCTVYWGIGEGDNPPSDASSTDVIATDVFPYIMTSSQSRTAQFDTRARWFRTSTIYTNNDIIINSSFKMAPTELSIRDDITTDNVHVNYGSGSSNNLLYVQLTDSSSVPLSRTNNSEGNALYTCLTDASGNALDVYNNALAVAVHDASNIAIWGTGRDQMSKNSMYAVITDVSGVEQASTEPITGVSAHAGRALFYSLSDHCGNQYKTSKNEATANSMRVHLTDSSGASISSTNTLPIFSTLPSRVVLPFDVSVEASMNAVSELSNHTFKLRHLGIANESPVTIWLKVYDMSTGANQDSAVFTDHVAKLIFNLPVTAGNFRDIHMNSGVTFSYGLHMRASNDFEYDNSYSNFLGTNNIYVLGSYSDISAN